VGSTFWLNTRFEKVIDEQKQDLWSTLRGRRVLIVSPNHWTRNLLRIHCQLQNMESTEISDRVNGLGELRRSSEQGDLYDLIIIDDQLSNIKEPDFISSVEADPATASIPIVSLVTMGYRSINGQLPTGTIKKPVCQSALYNCATQLLTPEAPQSDNLDAPIESLPDESPEAETQETQPQPDTSDFPNVLLVEDNAVSQMMIRAMLEEVGTNVDAVYNGKQALEAIENKDYDIVFMDCLMPEMDGFEATQEIRKLPGKTYLPVIALTAESSPEFQEKARISGMNDFLAKPIKIEDLQNLIERWVGEANAPPSDSSIEI